MSEDLEGMMSPLPKQASTKPRHHTRRGSARRAAAVSAAMALLGACPLWAQGLPGPAAGEPPGPPSGGAPGPPPSARAQAPIDLDGYWVSLVTEDWRYRMVVPGKGEYIGIPINLPAKQFADAWNPAADTASGKQCEAYGAAVLMRVPERLHISWQDDSTLRVDVDAGMQTRLLHFSGASSQPASWQGDSQAQWVLYQAFGPPGGQGGGGPPGGGGGGGRGGGGRRPGGGPPGAANAAPRWGTLHIMTTNMLSGLLRKNGVPYSDRTTLEEYWEMHHAPSASDYLTITSMVSDPVYLRATYYTTEIFTREADGSMWRPTPCTLTSTP